MRNRIKGIGARLLRENPEFYRPFFEKRLQQIEIGDTTLAPPVVVADEAAVLRELLAGQ